jgi:hypothetical protein
MLKRKKCTKNVYIDGLAASIASVIAMAGDNIIMPNNSMMMIHNAWTYTAGNSNDLRKLADDLDKVNKPGVYAIQAGINHDQLDQNGRPKYDYFHINMPSIVISDKLIDKDYQKISITQEGDKTILSTTPQSYNKFIKENLNYKG